MTIIQRLNSSFGILATVLGVVGVTIFQFIKEIDVWIKKTLPYNYLIKTDDLAGWCMILAIMIAIIILHLVVLNFKYQKKVKLFDVEKKSIQENHNNELKRLVDNNNIEIKRLSDNFKINLYNIEQEYKRKENDNLTVIKKDLNGLISSVEDDFNKFSNLYARLKNQFSSPLMRAKHEYDNLYDVGELAIAEILNERSVVYCDYQNMLRTLCNEKIPTLKKFIFANELMLDNEIVEGVKHYYYSVEVAFNNKEQSGFEDSMRYHFEEDYKNRVEVFENIKMLLVNNNNNG